MLYYVVFFTLFGSKLEFTECQYHAPDYNRTIYSTSVRISWNEDAKFTYSFLLVRFLKENTCEDGFMNVRSPATFNTTSDGKPLEPLQTYRSALCLFNRKGVSSELNHTNLRMAPPPPSNLRPTRNEPNLLQVEWEDYCNLENSTCPDIRKARNYIVTNQAIDDGSSSANVILPYSNETKKTIENLNSNTNYKITVTVRVYSTVLSNQAFLIATTVSNPPKNFTNCATNRKSTEVCLVWIKPEGGDAIEDYIVQWGTNHHAISHKAESTSYTYTINHLLPGNDVNIRIAARNAAGLGEITSRIFATYPSAPRNVKFTTEPHQINLEWKKPIGNFDEIWIESNFQQFKLRRISNPTISRYSIKELTPNTTYNISMYSVFMSSVGNRLESDKYQTTVATKGVAETVDINCICTIVVILIFTVITVTAVAIFFGRKRAK